MEFLAIACPRDTPPCELSGLVRLTDALLDALPLVDAFVDGFSDCETLPPDAASALRQLEEIAAQRHRRDLERSRVYRWLRRRGPTNMGVELNLAGEQRRIAAIFGPYSIHCEIDRRNGQAAVILHDSGTSVSVRTADDRESEAVQRLLADASASFRAR